MLQRIESVDDVVDGARYHHLRRGDNRVFYLATAALKSDRSAYCRLMIICAAVAEDTTRLCS